MSTAKAWSRLASRGSGTSSHSPSRFIPAGAQPAHRHRGLRDHAGVHAAGGVDDTRHDDTPGARGPEIRHHRAKVLRLHPVPPRIRRGLGVAHAQLGKVDVAGLAPGPRELGEDLPADRGLADSRRAAQPQDGDQIAGHRPVISYNRVASVAKAGTVTDAIVVIVAAATFRVDGISRLS